MALDGAVQIGKQTLQVGFGILFGVGATVNGVKCISGLVGLCDGSGDEVVNTGKKVQDIFLSAVRFIGMSAGTLRWAEFCSWISLGAASPYIGFICYPALFITSMFNLVAKCRQIEELSAKPNLDYREWKIGIEYVRLASQVCLVALAVIGALGVITTNPVLPLVVIGTVFTYGFLLGVAHSLDKMVQGWRPQAAPAT